MSWRPYLVFFIPIRGKLPTRKKLLSALRKHDVSDIRVVDVPLENMCTVVAREGVHKSDICAHIKRAINAELHVETVTIVYSLDDVEKVCKELRNLLVGIEKSKSEEVSE